MRQDFHPIGSKLTPDMRSDERTQPSAVYHRSKLGVLVAHPAGIKSFFRSACRAKLVAKTGLP